MGSNFLPKLLSRLNNQTARSKTKLRAKSHGSRSACRAQTTYQYDTLEDRRVLAAIGSFDVGSGLLTVSLTENNDQVVISNDTSLVTLNGSTDLDPNTTGVQSASFAAVRGINIVGDSTKTSQEVVFSGNYLNGNGAGLTSLTANNVRSVVFTGSYQFANNVAINLNQTGGQISDSAAGRLIVGGTSNLVANDNPINLDNATNDFIGNVTLSTGGVGRVARIADANNLQFAGVNVTGEFFADAGGDITDAAGTQMIGLLGGTFTASNVTLGDSTGDSVSFFEVGFNTTGDANITQVSNVRLKSTTASNLTVNSTNGIFDGETTVINVTNLATFNGAFRVRIGDNGSDRFNAGSVTFNSAGHVHITEDSGMNIVGTNTTLNSHLIAIGPITNGVNASITVTNNIGLDGSNIDLGNQTGDALSAGAFYFYAPNTVSLNANSNIHIVQVNNEANQLILVTPTSITDDVNAEIAVVGNSSFNAASVNLGDETTDRFNSGTVMFTTTGQFKISEDSTLNLTGVNTAGNSIINSTNLVTNGPNTTMAVANTAAFFGQNGINIGNQSSDVFNFGSLTYNSPGSVNISEDSATDILGVNTAQSLVLNSAGALTDGANVSNTIAGNAQLTGTSIALGRDTDTAPNVNTLNMGQVTFTSAGNVTLFEDSGMGLIGNNTANNLTLFANGDVLDATGTNTNVVGDFIVRGNLINLGATVVGDTATLNFGRVSFSSIANTNLAVNTNIVMFGENFTGNQLLLRSTGNITDVANTRTRVQNLASLTGADLIIGDLASECFDILAGGLDLVIRNTSSGVDQVTESNCP